MAITSTRETRARKSPELRLLDDDGQSFIEGYAAVFGKPSHDLGGFIEYIQPGAFRNAIKEDDVRALVNHVDGLSTIGRTASGTLELEEDKKGLKYRVKVPDTSAGRDVVELIKRGDITGSSFSFEAITDKWETIDGDEVRTLVEVRLFDVSPVTFPAYPDTDVAVRSRDAYRKSQKPVHETADAQRELDIARLSG